MAINTGPGMSDLKNDSEADNRNYRIKGQLHLLKHKLLT